MKNKISFILFLCIFLFSCKNESSKQDKKITSSPDKENPSTVDKNINDNNSLEQVKPALYKDEKDLYHLEYKLEVGKTYYLNRKEVTEESVTIGDKKQTVITQSYDPINVMVVNFKDGLYELKLEFPGKKVVTKADGKTIVIDSNGKKPNDENLAKTWNLYKIMNEAVVTLKLSKDGKVSNVSSMDNIVNKISDELKKTITDKEQFNQFMSIVKSELSSEVFRMQFEHSIMSFPEKGLAIGEKWNSNPEMKKLGYNLLSKVGEETTEVKLHGNIPSKSDSKKTDDGVQHSISINGSQEGSFIIDNKTGWVKNAKMSVIINQKETASKDGQSQSISKRSSITNYIN